MPHLPDEVANRRPVQGYLRLQGRFRHLSEETMKEIQRMVNEDYTKLMEKVACSRDLSK